MVSLCGPVRRENQVGQAYVQIVSSVDEIALTDYYQYHFIFNEDF